VGRDLDEVGRAIVKATHARGGLPGDPVRDKIPEVNRIISKLDDERNVFYVDIGPKFLDEKGAFLPDSFRADNLHPQAKGYDIWGAAVKDKLAELMQ